MIMVLFDGVEEEKELKEFMGSVKLEAGMRNLKEM